MKRYRDFLKMETRQNVISLFIFLLLLAGSCVVRPPLETQTVTRERQFRGIHIPAEWWKDLPADNLRGHLSRILSSTADSNYNVVLFELLQEETGTTGTLAADAMGDPVEWTIDEARRLGLKFYFSLRIVYPGQPEVPYGDQTRPQNPTQDKDRETNLTIAFTKTRLKDRVHDLAQKYDMDGFLFDLTEFPLADGQEDTAHLFQGSSDPAGDLLEELTVEGMLLKPYLVNLCAVPAEVFLSSPWPAVWLENGYLDGVVTVTGHANFIYRKNNPEYWNGGLPGNLFQGFRIAGDNQPPELQYLETLNGFVLFPDPQHGPPAGFPGTGFTDKKELPDSLKNIRADQVFSLDLSPIAAGEKAGRVAGIFPAGRKKVTDMDGCIRFTLKMPFDSLRVVLNDRETRLDTRSWQVPYDYAVLKDGHVIRRTPWLEFRRAPDPVTKEKEFHPLYKTAYPAKAWIDGDTVKVYETGIFFRPVKLKEGINRVEAGVLFPDSSVTIYTCEINYSKPPESREPFPLWIDERSITPQMDLVLLPDDKINITFRGSRGQSGQVVFLPDNSSIPCNRTDYSDYSLYETEVPLENWATGRKYGLTLVLMPEDGNSGYQGIEITTGASFTVRRFDEFPWISVNQDNSRLTYNLGAVRLGGPLKAEYPQGIVLKTNGIFGDQYRVFLNEVEEGFIQMENVKELPSPYSRSPYFITSLSCGPSVSADIVSIPYPIPIPYAIIPEPELKRIRIRLYGARTSSTWITHRKGCRLVDRLGWEQITSETYEVQIYLKTSAIWGYDLLREGNSLTFRVKYPPEFDPMAETPLAGLKIAIEAGHGGESYGAMGLSGLLEKDINLDLSLKFGEICRSGGAEVYQVRETDTTMSLLDKRDLARNSGADLLISIHANAAGTSRGYLGVAGTSTYYHNPFWAELAESMYNSLLELDLAEFGVVGSFNYTVIRNSEMPSILVEQAFMTHAEDEEKLARPAFRQAMAEKMYAGIIDYLRHMKMEKP